MKKLTTSVLAVVLSSTFVVANAQQKKGDTTIKEQQIGEVVVTGALGIKRKLDQQTSSAVVVGKDKLAQAGAPNGVVALIGKAPGLTINKTSSSVDGTYDVKINGTRTITGSTGPLIVIDGVISSMAMYQAMPTDMVDSVSVIEGLQGAALYGSQGINGAIIITTKKGSGSRKARVTLNSNIEFESVLFVPFRQKVYGQGWAGDRTHVENGSWGPSFNDPAFAGQLLPIGVPFYDVNGDGIISINPNDSSYPLEDISSSVYGRFAPLPGNNVKEFFKDGMTLNHTLSVTGGSEGAYAGMSINRQDREFIIADDKLKKTSVMFNGGFKLGKLSLDGTVTYINQTVSTTAPRVYSDLLQSSTEVPITAFADSPNPYGWNLYYQSPYWTIKNVRNTNKVDRLFGTITLDYKINDHISITDRGTAQITVNDGLNYNNGYNASTAVPRIPGAQSITSSISQLNNVSRYFYNDLIANFNYELTQDIDLKANVGWNVQQNQSKTTSVSGSGIKIPGIYQYWNLTNLTIPSNLNNRRFLDRKFAWFANVDLAYKDYLFVNLTGRLENSSKFRNSDESMPSNSSYFYNSAGVSFMPLKAFNAENDTFSRFVVKGSYVRVGNDPVGVNAIENTVVIASGFPYGTGPLSYVNNSTPTDPNTRPEIITSTELNLGLGFLKDRITLDATAYVQNTKDLITNSTTSNATGIRFVPMNVGDLRNKGVNVNLGLIPVRSQDFKWDMNLGWSINRTKVVELANGQDEVNLTSGGIAGIYAIKGEEFPILKATAYLRDDQGHIIINPDNGNPYYTNTYKSFGRVTPNYTLTFNTNFKYKNWGVYAVMDYRNGGVLYSGAMQGFSFSGQLEQSASFDRTQGGYIIPNSVYMDPSGQYVPNTSIKSGGSDYASVVDYYGSVYSVIGENFIMSATAFKVRELGVSYTLGRETAESIGLNGLSFSLYARNPFYKFAKENKGYADPEASFATGNIGGLSNPDQYPATRTIGFVTTINF